MLNEAIKTRRKAMKLSQVELASMLGVTKQSVSNWENDNIVPSIDMLLRMAEIFRCSTDCLLGRTPDNVLDVSGLSDEEIGHIAQIIGDLKSK